MEKRDRQIYKPRSAGLHTAGHTKGVSLLSKSDPSIEFQMPFWLTTSKLVFLLTQPWLAMIISAWRVLKREKSAHEATSTIIAGTTGTHAPLVCSDGAVEPATPNNDDSAADLLLGISTVSTAYRAVRHSKHCAPFWASDWLPNLPDKRRLKCPQLLVIFFFGCLVTLSSTWAPLFLLKASAEVRRNGTSDGQQYQETHHYSPKEKPSPTTSKKRFMEEELKQAGEAYQLAEQVIRNLESRGIFLHDEKIDGVLRSAAPQLQFLRIDAGTFEEAFRQIVTSRSDLASQAALKVEHSDRLTDIAQRVDELREGRRIDAGHSRSPSAIPNRTGKDAFTTQRQTGAQSRATQHAVTELDQSHMILGDVTSYESSAKGKHRFAKSLPSHEFELEVNKSSAEDDRDNEYWGNHDKTEDEETEDDQPLGDHMYAHLQNSSHHQRPVERAVPSRRKGSAQTNDGRSFPLFSDENRYSSGLLEHHSVSQNASDVDNELQGQQVSLTLSKSSAGKSGIVDKNVELTLDHHRPSPPQCGNNNGGPPARITIPFVASSFDAPGVSAVAILGRFRNDPKLLVEVFAESVIDSLPLELRRRWRVIPEEVELYSIKDCDLTIYVHCNYYQGRPDPNLGTSLWCSCAKTPSNTNTSHAATFSNNSHIRIEWNLLDFTRRGRKGTTELVRAVNADLQRKGKCAFMSRTTFGRTLSTIIGYPLRVVMAYYSIGAACRPGCRKPEIKPPVPSFPHAPSMPLPAPHPPVPDTSQTNKPSYPQPRPPFISFHSKPPLPLRPSLIPPKPANPLDCVFVGVDFFGFDVAKDETGEIHSASECAERCKYELTCFYWTFNQRRRWCYLKSALAPLGKYQDPVMTSSLVSGLKGCSVLPDAYPSVLMPPVVDCFVEPNCRHHLSVVGLCNYPSEPCYVRNINIITDPKGYNRCVQHCRTPLDCHAACVTDPSCFYWVFDETRRACTVKGRRLLEPTRVGGLMDTTGLTSGAKRCSIEHAVVKPRRLMEEDEEGVELSARRNLGTVGERHDDTCAFNGGDLHPAADETLGSGRAKHPTECRTRCVTHAVNTFNTKIRNPFPAAKDRDYRGSGAKMLEECLFWRFDWDNGICTLLGRDAWRTWKPHSSKQTIVGTHRCRQFSPLYPPLSALDLCYQEYIAIVADSSHLRLSVVPEVTSSEQCDLLCASQSKCISWTLQKGKQAKDSICTLFEGNAHKRKMVSPAYHLQHSYPDALINARSRSNKVPVESGLLGARRCLQDSMAILLSDASAHRNAELPVSPVTSQIASQDVSDKLLNSSAPRTAAQGSRGVNAKENSKSSNESLANALATTRKAADDNPNESPEEGSPAFSADPHAPRTGSMTSMSALPRSYSASAVWTPNSHGARHAGLDSPSATDASPIQSSTNEEGRQQEGSRSQAGLDKSSSPRIPLCSQDGLEYIGHDLLPRTSTPKSLSPMKCLALCAGTRLCFFWTYDAQSQLCYLKDVNAPSHARHRQPGTLISGSKYCPPLWESHNWAHSAPVYSLVSSPAAAAGTRGHITQFKDENRDENENVQEDQPPPRTYRTATDEAPASEADSSVLWSALSGGTWSTPALLASWLPAFNGPEDPSVSAEGGFLARNDAVTAASKGDREGVSQQRLQAAHHQGVHNELLHGKLNGQSSSHVQARKRPESVRHDTSHSKSHAVASLQGGHKRNKEVNLQENKSDPMSPLNITRNEDAIRRQPQNTPSPVPPFSPSGASTVTNMGARPSDLREGSEVVRAMESRSQQSPSLKCKEDGVALLGSDLTILGPVDGMGETGAIETPAQCALFCIHNAGCRYWSLDTKSRTCYLKPSNALQYYTKNESTKDFVSGPAISTEDCSLNMWF